MMHVATNHEVETFTGRYVDTQAPMPDTIVLDDIAHALAHTCRFGGHSRVFYSVAEHAIRVANKLVDQGYGELALAGLHHDDAEAYLGDIPRPLKPLLGDAYSQLTATMDAAVCEALGGLWSVEDLASAPILEADEWALRGEALSLMASEGEGWCWRGSWRVFGPMRAFLSPGEAEVEFLRRHVSLAHAWAPLASRDSLAPKESTDA